MHLIPGSLLGRYEVIAQIGTGGMGDVYRARDKRLGTIVALKTIKAAYAHDPTAQPRFERERRVTARLEHRHDLAAGDERHCRHHSGATFEPDFRCRTGLGARRIETGGAHPG